MADRISSAQLIASFRPLYRCMDIRVAAISEGDRWANALTVVRLSRLPATDIEHRQRMLMDRWGDLELDSIRIDMVAISSHQWEDLAESLRNGSLPLAGIDIAFPETVDLSAIEMRDYGVKQEEEWPHRIGIATRRDSLRWEQYDADVIRSKKFLSTLNALSTLLGLENFSRDNSTQLFLSVPIYAAIRRFGFAASACEFVAEFDTNLSDLMVSVYSTIGDSHTVRDRQNVDLSPTEGSDIGGGIRRMTSKVPLDTREHDKINLKLIHTPDGGFARRTHLKQGADAYGLHHNRPAGR